MPDQITSGGSTVTPTTIDGYKATRQGKTLLHWVVGRTNGSPDVTLRPANLRAGTLRLVFASTTAEADAKAAHDLFATAATFALGSTTRTTLNMLFVVPEGQDIGIDLDDVTSAAWVVTVPFQEYL